MELTKGSVYAVRADGAELIFDFVDADGYPYGYLRQKNGTTSTVGLFDKWQKVGNWTVVDAFTKHMSGQHDQSSHGNWAGGTTNISSVKSNKDVWTSDDGKQKSVITKATAIYTDKNGAKYNFEFYQEIDAGNPNVWNQVSGYVSFNPVVKTSPFDWENSSYQGINPSSMDKLTWESTKSDSATINTIHVSKGYRRLGIASAMLEFARQQSGITISHSSNLTSEGKSWSEIVKHLAGQHDQSSHGNWAHGEAKYSVQDITDETLVGIAHDVIVAGEFPRVFVGFEEVDGTISDDTKKLIYQTIAELQTHFPIEGMRVEFDDSKMEDYKAKGHLSDVVGFCTLGKGEIVLSMETAIQEEHNLWGGDPARADSKANYIMSVLAHEWGHALDKRTQSQLVDDQLAHDEYKNYLAQSKSEWKWKKEGQTTYGMENTMESYAEAFAEWFFSAGQTSLPHVQEMALKYGWDTGVFNLVKTMGSSILIADTFSKTPPPSFIELPDVSKHLAGQHDQSTHGNWAKTKTDFRHAFGVNDLVLENADVHESKINGSSFATFFDNRDNITEDQKRDVLALVHDLQTIAPLSPMSEVKIVVSNDFDYDSEMQRGWTVNFSEPEKMKTVFDEKNLRTVRELVKPAIHKVIIAVRPEDMNHYADEDTARQSWMPSANAKQFFAMEYFLAHEWGHATNYDALFHKGGNGTMAGSGYKNEQTTGLMLMAHENQLSPYGRSNTGEGYAEAFAEWFMTDGKSEIPIVQALAKEDKWGMQYKWKK